MASDQQLRAFYEKLSTETLPKTPLFGVPLDKYMEAQKKNMPFLNEPWVVRKCCDYLRDYGLKTEGIFRVPGATSTVKKISDQFDAGLNPDFTTGNAYVEDVAGVLKKYLREQPEPLISDGTADDPLQKAFLAALELEEDSPAQVSRFKELLAQLPLYRKTLLLDLFHLFSCITAHSQWNLMTSDNVATIFGGMTDIMTSLLNPSQRTHLVRFLIEKYSVVFDGILELSPKPVESEGKDLKEAIRVYLHDGTFKSLYCQTSEPAKEVQKKTIQKIQQTTDVQNPASYQLYEVRDALWRKIGENERILAIIKSGSAVLITDRLKGDKNESPTAITAPTSPEVSQAASLAHAVTTSGTPPATSTPPAAGSGAPPKLAVPKIPKARKGEKSPRGGSQSEITGGAGAGAGAGASRPSPREIQPPLPFNQPLQMLMWVFPSIPAHSIRATEWEPTSTVEASVDLQCTLQGSTITVSTSEHNWIFAPSAVVVVEDSTRYFILHSESDGHRIGLGFETREEALKFKQLSTQMVQYDQVHTINADPSTQNKSAITFASGPLTPHDILADGFYDSGIVSPTGNLANLKDLTSLPADSTKTCEVLLVDKTQDVRLAKYLDTARGLIANIVPVDNKLSTLASYVSSVFGGIETTVDQSLEGESPAVDSPLQLAHKASVAESRARSKSNIIKIGNITHGLARHRAILYKYLADRLNLQVALVRAVSTRETGYHVLVPTFSPNQFVSVDLISTPGYIHSYSSSVTKTVLSSLHGKLAELTTGTLAGSAPILQETHKVSPPTVGPTSALRVFGQIGSSATTRVFRGALGHVPVAVKEVFTTDVRIPDTWNGDLADQAAGRVNLSHPNIAATFGHEFGDKSFRFITEYLGLGSLADHLQNRQLAKEHFDDGTLWFIIHEVAQGLKHLHDHAKCHGNLTPSNVVVDGDGLSPFFSVVKITDAQLTNPSSARSTAADVYRAPEVINKAENINAQAADIWSLGVLIASLVTLKRPFGTLSTHSEIAAALSSGTAPLNVHETSAFHSLVAECTATDYAARPAIATVAQKAADNIPAHLKPFVQTA